MNNDESLSVKATDEPISGSNPLPPEKKLLKFPNLPKAELGKIAKDIAGNLIYTSNHLRDPNLIGNVFMPIILGGLSGYTQEQIADIGFVYEYYDQAGNSSINGCPIFFSCRIVSKHDAKIIWEKVKKIQKVLNEI